MKLPIRHEYFEKIKAGVKEIEFRDAHITFIDLETGEKLRKNVIGVWLTDKHKLPKPLDKSSMFTNENIIALGNCKICGYEFYSYADVFQHYFKEHSTY